MSLILIYADRKRALIASDDAAHYEKDDRKHRLPGRYPKFVVLPNGLFFGCVGRTEHTNRLLLGTARLASENALTFTELAGQLRFAVQKTWNERRALKLTVDKLDAVLLGFDPVAQRIRCVFWLSDRGFDPVETTDDPKNRSAAIGAFEAEDEGLLQQFTNRMGHALGHCWIAAEMRKTIDQISERRPEVIGKASYFAAVNKNGILDLPADFPQPPRDFASPAAQSACGPGRMFVGSIATPRQGALDTVGNNDGGSGAQYGLGTTLGPTSVAAVNISGTGTTSNPWNAADGDDTTYAEMHVQLTGASFNQAGLQVQGPASVLQRNLSAAARIVWSCPQNDGQDGPLQTYFQIWDQVANAFVFQFSLANLTTYPITETIVPLPNGVNLARYFFGADVAEGPTAGGDIFFRIHEIQWLTQQ